MAGQPKLASTAKTCDQCHKTLFPEGATNQVKDNYMAVGYVDAMHGNCVTCHKDEAQKRENPKFAQCASCHNQEVSDSVNQAIASQHNLKESPWVTIPQLEEDK
jgi:hypothetical protein